MTRWKLPITVLFAISEGIAQQNPKDPSVTIGVYLVVPCEARTASKERVKVSFRPRNYGGVTGDYCLERKPIVDQNDIQFAEMLEVDRPPAVGLTLYAAAAQRMLDTTKKNISGPMAVFVNRRLVSVPQIVAPTPRPVIQGQLTQAQAEAIIRTFRRQEQ